MSDRRDVSGVWYGRFSGTGNVFPNRFVAVLTEHGGTITGTTSEPDGLGDAETLRAVVTGVRTGGSVSFVKQYDGAAYCAHAVNYDGRIDADGLVMTGDWRFAHYSGRFVMQRERFDEELLAEEQGVALDAPVGAR